jgi:hypothetical protein
MSRSVVVRTLALAGLGSALVCGCQPPDGPLQTHRCSPHAPLCPGGQVCCSDDPAALDLDALDVAALPEYLGRGGTGTPLFSGGNNSRSISGICIEAGAVPIEGALSDIGAQGCPVPCNPNWENADIEVVCGEDTICCQTLELEPEDCVFDPSLGDAGCHRPVTGVDITDLGGLDATQWKSTQHATHQDPEGTHCKDFVAGMTQAELDAKGITVDELRNACFRRLAVADTRGFCLGKSLTVTTCPLDDPNYDDACDLLNRDESRSGCG